MPRPSATGGWDGVVLPSAVLGAALVAMGLTHLLRPGGSHRGGIGDSGVRLAGSVMTQVPAVVSLGMASILLLTLTALELKSKRLLRPGALGRARQATRRDLRAFRPRRLHSQELTRLCLGMHGRTPIQLPAEDHLLVLGPTGSGKSSALAIPAILEWAGPVVVTDPKGELLRATISARTQLGPGAVFAPLMRPSDPWNPIASVRSSEDALRTAGFLMGRPPEREPFWHDLALQLLHGLLVEAATHRLTLADLFGLLQTVPGDELISEMVHPVSRRLVQGALSGGDRTAMGVVATLVAKLTPFGTDTIAEATSSSAFDPAGLADGTLKTLYCLVTPHDAPLLRGVTSALLACCWRALYAAPPRVPVLFVLDEFAQLTLLSELPAMVQLGRSQGVRMLLMAQDLASISSTYGAEATAALWANCRTKLLLPGISEIELLEKVSRLAGSTTLHRSDSAERGDPVAAHPLLAADEVRRLADNRALILRGSDQPAVIRQRRWYNVPALAKQVGLPLEAASIPRPAAGRALSQWGGGANRLPWSQGPADLVGGPGQPVECTTRVSA